MNEKRPPEQIHTVIWDEEPEPDNPFATRTAWCCGYDVYGDMLGRSRWVEMLYLLFRREAPTTVQAELLEMLAVALANPGPRDPSVHAAMCGGAGGSTAAACLMAALGVGSGNLAGGREIFAAMALWLQCGADLKQWTTALAAPAERTGSIWPVQEHPPGFDPHGVSTATTVRQTLSTLAVSGAGQRLLWLAAHLPALEAAAGMPLAMAGVAAAALSDLGFTPEQGEMLYLLLRLPGAAAHALEQKEGGYKSFPFFRLDLEDDPGEVVS